jgi:hypothetical protein
MRRCRQRLRLQAPLHGEHGRAFRAERQEPRSVFDDHAFSHGKVERLVGPGPIADQERRIAGTALPFAVRPVEARGSGGGGDQELCPLGL